MIRITNIEYQEFATNIEYEYGDSSCLVILGVMLDEPTALKVLTMQPNSWHKNNEI